MTEHPRDAPLEARPVLDEAGLADVTVAGDGKTRRLWGRDGRRREAELVRGLPEGSLPVLVGSGLGVALEALLDRGPVAVVDRQQRIWEATGVRDRLAGHQNLFWPQAKDGTELAEMLRQWRAGRGGAPAVLLKMPLYLRLDPEWARAAELALSGESPDFWTRAAVPRFRSPDARVLFLTRKYFLIDEIRCALERRGVAFEMLEVGEGETVRPGFVEDLLSAVVRFRPDFALTVNHFGLDREGRLAELLQRLNLPLASWFVDNPHLILSRYKGLDSPLTALFTWDAGNLDSLRALGFPHVFYLPLATDPLRFRPGAGPGPASWHADVSFVGHSMAKPVAEALGRADPPADLRRGYGRVAEAFGRSGETSVVRFLEERFPELAASFRALPSLERQLAYESLVTWESTRRYRLSCLERTLPFRPLVVGDEGWLGQLGRGTFRRLPPLNYYQDLPRFYPLSRINFNCTSLQMKGAVNQRVFDVPACGAFLLTDHRDQLEDLFEPGREVVVYGQPEDIPDLIRRFLDDEPGRRAVAEAARRRILAEHTYEARLDNLMAAMRRTFGGG